MSLATLSRLLCAEENSGNQCERQKTKRVIEKQKAQEDRLIKDGPISLEKICNGADDVKINILILKYCFLQRGHCTEQTPIWTMLPSGTNF